MEIYDSEDIKVYMLTKRILFSVMLIVSPSVVASEKAPVRLGILSASL